MYILLDDILFDDMELRDDEGREFVYDGYDSSLEGTGAGMGAMGETWYVDSEELCTPDWCSFIMRA